MNLKTHLGDTSKNGCRKKSPRIRKAVFESITGENDAGLRKIDRSRRQQEGKEQQTLIKTR